MQVQAHDPVVNIGVNEFILALGLDHVVALLAQAPDHTEDGELGQVGEWVASLLDVIVHREHRLLQVVDGCQGARTPNPRTAVQHYFVIGGDIGQLFSVKHAFSTSFPPMMHS